MDASRQDEAVPLQLDEETDSSTEEGGLDAAVSLAKQYIYSFGPERDNEIRLSCDDWK